MASSELAKTWMEATAKCARERRKALGLTQRDAAALAQCHYVFVNDLEQGKPTLRLDKVLDVLGALGLLPEVPCT